MILGIIINTPSPSNHSIQPIISLLKNRVVSSIILGATWLLLLLGDKAKTEKTKITPPPSFCSGLPIGHRSLLSISPTTAPSPPARALRRRRIFSPPPAPPSLRQPLLPTSPRCADSSPARIRSTVVAASLLPCTRSTSRRRLPPPPLIQRRAPSSQTKEEAPRSSHHGGATGLLVDARGVDDSTARATRSITPVLVVRVDKVARRGAARSRGVAGDQEVGLLVPETPASWGLSASASKSIAMAGKGSMERLQDEY